MPRICDSENSIRSEISPRVLMRSSTASHLFSASTQPRPSRSISRAICRSWSCTPSVASMASTTISAIFSASSEAETDIFSSSSSMRAFLRRPAVSTSSIGPCSSASRTETASRVRPGSGPVIMRSSPSRRFSSVDLPAFGRPTMASRSGPGGRGGTATSSPSSPRPGSKSSSSAGTGSGAACSGGRRSTISPIRSDRPSPCSADTATGLPRPRL